MVATKGHGNPPWTKDETILALDLLLRSLPKVPNSTDSSVIELSIFLQGLPIHSKERRKPSFRNAASVGFKVGNLNAARTGRGLSNKNRLDTEVWAEFGDKPELVSEIAKSIRAAAETLQTELSDLTDDDPVFNEGRLLTRWHRFRERRADLRKAVLAMARQKDGLIQCSACRIRAPKLSDNELEESIFEVHHIMPLAYLEAEGRITKISDATVLCANCHRLIHRVISKLRRWITVEEFKTGFLHKVD